MCLASCRLEKTAHLMLYLCKSVFNLQQQNFKQKVVALLKRFKVSDEVSNSFCQPPCLVCCPCLVHLALVFRNTPVSFCSLHFVFKSTVDVTFPYTLALQGGLRANF